VDLRGHVALCAKLGLAIARSIATGNRSSEAEVGNLKIEELIVKYVLRL